MIDAEYMVLKAWHDRMKSGHKMASPWAMRMSVAMCQDLVDRGHMVLMDPKDTKVWTMALLSLTLKGRRYVQRETKRRSASR